MVDETEEPNVEDKGDGSEEPVKRARLKISKPNPIIYVLLGPAAFIFIVYVVLNNVFLSSNLNHEAKLEKVLSISKSLDVTDSEAAEEDQKNLEEEPVKEETGFLDTHNYYQFQVPFAINISDGKRILTFELAVSSFQSGVTAEWFFESFEAFVPAIRSDILYFMEKFTLEKLQEPNFQNSLVDELKDVINSKLENLGGKPEVNKVLLLRYIIT
jgi:flagellar basal body-associated protein FliL